MLTPVPSWAQARRSCQAPTAYRFDRALCDLLLSALPMDLSQRPMQRMEPDAAIISANSTRKTALKMMRVRITSFGVKSGACPATIYLADRSWSAGFLARHLPGDQAVTTIKSSLAVGHLGRMV